MITEPNLNPRFADTASVLTTAVTLLEPTTLLPAPWVLLLTTSWTHLAALLRANRTDEYREDAKLIVRLSRAGCQACMAGARSALPAAILPWQVAQTAHRKAWTALAMGWPNLRPTVFSLPVELSNLSPTRLRPLTTDAADYYLSVLLQDVIGITWANAALALEAIPAGVRISGVTA